MAAITVTSFAGIAPVIPAKYLKPTQAQTALNCATWNGPIQPLYDQLLVIPGELSGIQTIYKFGQEEDDEDKYWFQWDTDVDVVKGFISGDASERTFYTGDGIPKATDNALATSGGVNHYPRNSYMLGVPVPTAAPSVTSVDGEYDATTTPETRSYIYTIVNSWGEESAPSLPTELVDVYFGQTVTLLLPSFPTGNYNPETRRIYRSATGTQSSAYLYVGTEASGNYVDSVPAELLNEALPSLDWFPPPAALEGLVGLPGGVLAGFVGNDVFFSEPFRPFAWPEGYSQVVGSKIVGLATIDTTLVVLTQGKPVFMQGSHPANMRVVEADLSQACVSKGSIVTIGRTVYYASPDGLIGLAPGGSKILSEGVFARYHWNLIKPGSIKAYTHDNQYYAFYDTGTEQGGFVYDMRSNSFTVHDMYADAGYSDLQTDTLYTVTGNNISKWGEGDVKKYTWRSKVHLTSSNISMSCFRVDAEAYPVTFTLWKDGEVHHTQEVLEDKIYRLPSGLGREWDFQVETTAEVFAVQLAQSPSELAKDRE